MIDPELEIEHFVLATIACSKLEDIGSGEPCLGKPIQEIAHENVVACPPLKGVIAPLPTSVSDPARPNSPSSNDPAITLSGSEGQAQSQPTGVKKPISVDDIIEALKSLDSHDLRHLFRRCSSRISRVDRASP